MAFELKWAWKQGCSDIHEIIAAGDTARDGREWVTAAAAYQEALQARSDLPAIWVQYGNMLKEDEQFEKAESAYLEALRQAPDDADAHLMYGHLLKLTNRLEEAAAYYHRSALLDPKRPDARRELNSLAEQGINHAQVRLLAPHSVPHSWSLNAKLVGARMQIAEVMADLRRIEARELREVSGEYRRTLSAAYDSIGPLIRTLNGARYCDVVNEASTVAPSTISKISVVFDISDLIQYFRDHRLPTGIQRVQIETIYAALMNAQADIDIRVCCFTETHDYWREVPPADFINLCELSPISNDLTAADWRSAIFDLNEKLRISPNFRFPKGAFLVNIGTSWWLQNYFLKLRQAKKRDEIKYVPFVHDMIPIMTPEHCVVGLTQDFISWVLGVFFHADYYIANSEATERDLRNVANALGYELNDDRIHTVRLDANFRKVKEVEFDTSALLTHRLMRPQGYVLFVSTIESRKNHHAAFDAWIRLCKKHGTAKVPRLVCVGSRGWLNDAVYARLGSSEELKDRVVILSGVPERELELLYRECLFTLFPSFYEGWGLPVVESLCYGKVPLVSDSSSLPEAGGEFAHYFELGNETKLVEALERLIFDTQYRCRRAALIRQKYCPRSWEDIGKDLIGALERWQRAEEPNVTQDAFVPVAILARYYGLNRNTEIGIYRSMVCGEIFRTGDGWWGCEDWGCWTKPAPVRLIMRVAEGAGQYRLYLGLHGLPTKDTPYDVTVSNCPTDRGVLDSQKVKWIWFDLEISDSDKSTVNIVLQGYETDSARLRPDAEPRTVAIGVIGFMLCRQDDLAGRANFIEAIALGNIDRLTKPTQ